MTTTRDSFVEQLHSGMLILVSTNKLLRSKKRTENKNEIQRLEMPFPRLEIPFPRSENPFPGTIYLIDSVIRARAIPDFDMSFMIEYYLSEVGLRITNIYCSRLKITNIYRSGLRITVIEFPISDYWRGVRTINMIVFLEFAHSQD